MIRRRTLIVISLIVAGAAVASSARGALRQRGFGPGERVLLDAHNAYPEKGKWADRIERALATGMPLAIEQDLYWQKLADLRMAPVVAHDAEDTEGAPTFEHYFLDRIAPLMDQALRDNRREEWPLVVLNLDFKTNERALHRAVLALLAKHDAWLTTAERTRAPFVLSPMTVGPLLVLCGQDPSQRADFHDAIQVGDRIRVFGAIPVPSAGGATREERARNLAAMSIDSAIGAHASNYARWVNFPWGIVESGGQVAARDWSTGDAARLRALVERAHAAGLWIRFYTLDGFTPVEDRGYTASYNFGSADAAALRWRAVIDAGVDFVATDQYEDFGALVAPLRQRR